MFVPLLAVTQILSTWASSLPTFDATVNTEIRKLEMSVDPSRQVLNVKDIKIEMAGAYYYAFIIYEIQDKERK